MAACLPLRLRLRWRRRAASEYSAEKTALVTNNENYFLLSAAASLTRRRLASHPRTKSETSNKHSAILGQWANLAPIPRIQNILRLFGLTNKQSV